MEVGFSNHSPGIIHCSTAVALGASVVEFHITMDRTMKGSDHAASIEPVGAKRLVGYIRATDSALQYRSGVLEEETEGMLKLRRVK